MMENRSYDHYFGAYPKGRGFDDHGKHSLGAFAQHYPGPIGATTFPKHRLLPFHLDSRAGFECTHDLTHGSSRRSAAAATSPPSCSITTRS
jgi:phospholipase C